MCTTSPVPPPQNDSVNVMHHLIFVGAHVAESTFFFSPSLHGIGDWWPSGLKAGLM